ncbi:hypothetical protein [Psychrobacillus psychrodurans]|uniref:hypothetical protein n=1 Tax=Psychrobacillus psychrodurans TaxID=126157 RepID=UPI0008ECFD53|nr:hypothetical protein [Psychrobacillus psychrodurans]MCZ8542450.1 hypothetical protein [Psychrobacillus psychrodurans]SFN23058.1 hypothetical protein SAMN05421832_12324 [Psychrobacillus psychrodurans]
MLTINDIEYAKQRMADLEKEARRYKLGHNYLSRKKKIQKSFLKRFFSYFTRVNLK